MDYQTALDRINHRGKYGMKLGLQRIEGLLSLLGNPQEELRVVHVAGTNGKGSASTLAAAGLTSCGYRTGLFTSPYVIDFRERFQIDGEMISKEELTETVTEVETAVQKLEAGGDYLTWFEYITAVAFLWFRRHNCDFVVLEVGLGGRMDTTNVISQSAVSVIMQIALDHTKVLGSTIREIAAEKAGIIKPGGQVVLYPVQDPETVQVIRAVCRAQGAALTVPDLTELEIRKADRTGSRFSLGGTELATPFAGKHQILNAATAYTALSVLRDQGYPLPEEKLRAGFLQAHLPARMELLTPALLVDGGHNPACARALKQFLSDFTPGEKRIGVMGMMGDKDVAETLKIIAPMFSAIYAVPIEMPRAMTPQEFALCAKAYCKDVRVCGRLEEVLPLVRAQGEGMTVVCGSFFLASAFRDAWKEAVSRERIPQPHGISAD